MAHLAYFDESGDPGIAGSPSRFYVLSCVLIPESEWMACLDALVDLRGRLKRRYGIPTRPELKATDIRKGHGALTGLGIPPAERARIFRALMWYQARCVPGLSTFAIAIEKANCVGRGWDVREAVWQFALQRVDRFCKAADSRAVLFPDEGHGRFIRLLTRRLRRHQVIDGAHGGRLSIPMERIIEDPNDRKSHDSYFIQLADWNAYAAHRSRYVFPLPAVAADSTWDELGAARLLAVNSVRGGPPGLVVWP